MKIRPQKDFRGYNAPEGTNQGKPQKEGTPLKIRAMRSGAPISLSGRMDAKKIRDKAFKDALIDFSLGELLRQEKEQRAANTAQAQAQAQAGAAALQEQQSQADMQNKLAVIQQAQQQGYGQ
jgi:hypothetical protein